MYTADFISILGKVEKLQKKNESYDPADNTNGVWLLHDTDRQCIVMLGFISTTLYWEETFSVRPDEEKELYDKLQADAKLPDTEKCFPCKIIKDDLPWIITKLKSYKNDTLWLTDFVRDSGKVKLVCQLRSKLEPIELPARAEADNPNSIDNSLYKEMVRHGGNWADKYAHMENGGWCCNIYSDQMKLCMELMSSKDKKHAKPVSLVLYGAYGSSKRKDGSVRKYIEQDHWEILDVDDDAERHTRGVLLMVVKQLEGQRWHYIE